VSIDRFGYGALVAAALLGGGIGWAALRDAPSARLERAAELVFEQRHAEAATAYRALIDGLDRDDDREAWVEAHARLAEVLWMGLGDPRGAAEVYRRLVAEAPQAEESWVARERLAELARNHFGDVHEAIAHWQALATSGRPGADRFAMLVARAYLRLQDWEQARREALALAQRSPDGAETDDALYLVATAWQLEGKHDEAVAAFEEVERRWPGTEIAARARYQIGQSRASQRDWDAAQAALLEALETHPDPWRVQADLARVRKHLAEERKVRPLSRDEALHR